MLQLLPQFVREAIPAPLSGASHAATDDESSREAALHAFALFGAGVVHEINNPLAIALLSAQVAFRSLPEGTDPRTRRCLERAIESIHTTAETVRGIVRECGQSGAVACKFDVRDVLRFVTLVMKPHAERRGCEIAWRVSQHESLVDGNPIELEIALANSLYRIVTNGTKTIEISSYADRESVSIHLDYDSRSHVKRSPNVANSHCPDATSWPGDAKPADTDGLIQNIIRTNGGTYYEGPNELGGTNVTISAPVHYMTQIESKAMELPVEHLPFQFHPADVGWWRSVDHCVHVIDDDGRFLDILSCVLEGFDFHVESYPSAERFLATLTTHEADCVLLDMRMPSMTGIELLKALRSHHVNTPVLILSAYSDTPGVVAAMQNGAADYLVKPTNEQELLTKVSIALHKNWSDKRRCADKNQRLRSLSAREREVMDLFADAKTTTQVAHALGISPKTVEKHRLNIFDKLNVDSVPAMIRLVFDCTR